VFFKPLELVFVQAVFLNYSLPKRIFYKKVAAGERNSLNGAE